LPDSIFAMSGIIWNPPRKQAWIKLFIWAS
jgi:hypothetical protein